MFSAVVEHVPDGRQVYTKSNLAGRRSTTTIRKYAASIGRGVCLDWRRVWDDKTGKYEVTSDKKNLAFYFVDRRGRLCPIVSESGRRFYEICLEEKDCIAITAKIGLGNPIPEELANEQINKGLTPDQWATIRNFDWG